LELFHGQIATYPQFSNCFAQDLPDLIHKSTVIITTACFLT
jgi:hypothetical protein